MMKKYSKLEIEVFRWEEDIYMDIIQTSSESSDSFSAEFADNTLNDFFD